jgi:hypothetical protein
MAIEQLTHRTLHIDLIHQVHAAAKIETEFDGRQP